MTPARLHMLQRELSELAVSLDISRRRLAATERVIAAQRAKIEALIERITEQSRRREARK